MPLNKEAKLNVAMLVSGLFTYTDKKAKRVFIFMCSMF